MQTIKRRQTRASRLRFEHLESRRLLATVNIDPGGFEGTYDITGLGRFEDAQVFDLTPGNYQMRVLGSSNFDFSVDTDGMVTSLNTDAATTNANTLTLNNVTVNVEPGSFAGVYDLVGRFSGPQAYVLVPGLTNYSLKVNATSPFTFNLDAAGNVSSNNAAAAMGVGDTLYFNTTTVTVDPQNFAGYYDLVGRDPGIRSFELVPGVDNYTIKVLGTARFTFGIDGVGNVISNNAAAATGSGDTLTFHNTQVNIDPGEYLGYYDLVGRLTGPQTYTLVPGINDYRVGVAGIGGLKIQFDIDANGDLTSLNADAAVGQGNTLVFQNSTIQIDPGGYTSSWYVTGLTGATGVQIIDLPKGLSGYKLNVFGATPSFSVDGNGDPQPVEIELTTNSGAMYTFLLSKYVVEPPVIQVEIDVKPDSDSNTVNVASNGTIAVAILTTDTFDASTVNTSSVVFAGALADHFSYEDVDQDGDLDLLMHFRTNETNLEQLYQDLLADDLDGDGVLDTTNQVAQVSLFGETLEETMIEGSDELNLFLRGRALRDVLAELFGG